MIFLYETGPIQWLFSQHCEYWCPGALVATVLSMHPCVSCCLWVNSLWPSDAIWRQRSWSTLVQVMACCLTAPSHYLNQCWLMICEVLWHLPDSNFTENTGDIYHWDEFEIYWLETVVKSPQGPANELTHWGRVTHICVGNLTIIGSDNGLSPGRRQAIIWTSAGIL